MEHEIRTAAGLIDVWHPDSKSLTLQMIAGSLSKLCRFTGHIHFFYSVAEHSVLVSKLVERWGRERQLHDTEILIAARWALLHDAAETLSNDINSPFKQLLVVMDPNQPGISIPIGQWEHQSLAAFALHFELPTTVPKIVHEADFTLYQREAEWLRQPDYKLAQRAGLDCHPWKAAEELFIARATYLGLE